MGTVLLLPVLPKRRDGSFASVLLLSQNKNYLSFGYAFLVLHSKNPSGIWTIKKLKLIALCVILKSF
jgi:hypothetical protein